MSKSRYIRWVKHRVPRPKHPVLMPSANTVSTEKTSDEEGKWVRCRRCGFPLNLDRDILGMTGDTASEEPVIVQDFDYEEINRLGRGSNALPGNRFNRPALEEGDYTTPVLDKLDMQGTVIQNDPNGNADSFTYTPRKTVITGGCPFCGSDNL